MARFDNHTAILFFPGRLNMPSLTLIRLFLRSFCLLSPIDQNAGRKSHVMDTFLHMVIS